MLCVQVQYIARQVFELGVLVQAEGGFVYALGMLLQEDVTYNAKGKPEFDTTWNYKIPSAACIPRDIIIRMLQVCAHMACTTILLYDTNPLLLTCSASDMLTGHTRAPQTCVVCPRCMKVVSRCSGHAFTVKIFICDYTCCLM